MSVKIFQVNECEWWAGETAEQVLVAYMEDTGLSHEEATGDVDTMPEELTDADLARFKFVHDEEVGELNPPITFGEQLQRMIEQGDEFPCAFATTEW